MMVAISTAIPAEVLMVTTRQLKLKQVILIWLTRAKVERKNKSTIKTV
jgi:hypothetical protein